MLNVKSYYKWFPTKTVEKPAKCYSVLVCDHMSSSTSQQEVHPYDISFCKATINPAPNCLSS